MQKFCLIAQIMPLIPDGKLTEALEYGHGGAKPSPRK